MFIVQSKGVRLSVSILNLFSKKGYGFDETNGHDFLLILIPTQIRLDGDSLGIPKLRFWLKDGQPPGWDDKSFQDK